MTALTVPGGELEIISVIGTTKWRVVVHYDGIGNPRSVIHREPYSTLGEADRAARAWIAERQRVSGQ